MPPSNRGLIGGAFDSFFTWKNGLPPETCNYSVESLFISADDGVKLAADLYLPVDAEPLGTILVRTPYGLSVEASMAAARVFAARGYQVLHNSCRGTFDSEGELDPAVNEPADGQAVLKWMRQQPWYTGSFATLGPSYLGLTQWCLLNDPPKDMKTAIISTGPQDFGRWIWGEGALRTDILIWADINKRLRVGSSRIGLLVDVKLRNEYMAPVCNSLPLLQGVDDFFGGRAPEWLRQTLQTPDLKDKYWAAKRQEAALQKVDIPILLSAGWDDVMLDPVMDDYRALKARGCNVALTVGPWTHAASGGVNTLNETIAWLEAHYIHTREHARDSPVRIFVTGAQEWRNMQEWPPSTSSLEFFLGPQEQLAKEKPTRTEAESKFTFDPNDPTPSMGGPRTFDNGTIRGADCRALTDREDVITFDSEVLDQDVEVFGRPSISLHHSTNHPNADLWAVLLEVDATGKARSITEKYMRLDLARESDAISFDMADCAHRFRKGGKIRLHIAGGSHPRFIRNLGSGEHPATGTTLQAVEHTVQHNASRISRLVLPVSSLNSQ